MRIFEPVRRDELRVEPVQIRAGQVVLHGDLGIPHDLWGLVLFVHGSGSSRHSPRNQHVAHLFQSAGLGTLLFDLLPEEELTDSTSAELRFNIELLTERLLAATAWAEAQASEHILRLAYFGSSTGAAAALRAAALGSSKISAVVSRGGRPDLAHAELDRVRSPTLLIVGGRDEPVVTLNRYALEALACEKRLEIVPGATHLFEQPGALDAVAQLAIDWFREHLGAAARDRV